MESFERRLEALINEFSRESESNTPDFIQARYMNECLGAFVRATNRRDSWHGFPLASPFEAPTGGTQE